MGKRDLLLLMLVELGMDKDMVMVKDMEDRSVVVEVEDRTISKDRLNKGR